MSIQAGLSENFQLLDQNGSEIQNLFGSYASAFCIIDESTRREGTIGTHKPSNIADGPVENRAGITCKPNSLEILKVMGSFDSNAGTIEFTKFLPELNELNAQFTENKRFHFEDLKFGAFVLTSSVNNSVQIEFGPIHAKTGQIQQNTVDVPEVKDAALQWTDTEVKINGSKFGSVDDVNTEYNRNLRAIHALGEGREPSDIIERQANIEPGFLVKVEDASAWEEILDDSSYPLQVQDKRSPISEISFDFGDGNGELVIENGKIEVTEFEFDEEPDERTVELSFEGADISVRNL